MPQVVAQIVVSVVISAAIGAVRAVLSSGQKKVSQPKTNALSPVVPYESPLANSTVPNGPQIGIFGRGRVGGRVVLSAKAANGKNYRVLNVAGSPATVNAIYLNNALISRDGSGDVTNRPWKAVLGVSSYNIAVFNGSQTVADSVLSAAFPAWTSAMVGKSQTYLRITIDATIDPSYAAVYQAGEPDITCDVSGFPCFDPRDPGQSVSNPATWTFSSNSALIGAGYLMHNLGRGLSGSDIDWASVQRAADVCDVQIEMASGLFENQFECFLVWQTNERHEDVLQRVADSMAGRIYQLGGKYVVEAGNFDLTDVVDITPDDYAGDGLAFSDTTPIDAICNGVRGQFASPTNNFEMRDYPAYQDAAALAADGGLEYWLPADFPAVKSASQAQRLARIKYRQIRNGASASVDLKFKHFDTVRGDLVRLTDALAGMSGEVFRVEADKVSGQDYVITLDLSKDSAGNYAWSVLDERPMPPTVELGSAGGAGVNPDDLGALQPPGATVHVQPGSSQSSWTVVFTFFSSPSSRADEFEARCYVGKNASSFIFKPASGHDQVAASGGATISETFASMPSDYYNSVYTHAFGFSIRSRVTSSGEQSVSSGLSVSTSPNTLDNGAPYNSASTTPLYCLPPPAAPQIASQGSGTALLNFYIAGGGARATHIELWENSTNDFNTASKINDVANANGTKTVTASLGATRYYWTRSRNSADGRLSPVSNALLVGF